MMLIDQVLVNVSWVYDRLDKNQLIILNATLPKAVNNNLPERMEQRQIPGARSVNLKKDFSDPTARFPNTLPDETKLNRVIRNLGINNDSVIVVYDEHGIYSSARLWWLLKAMGHKYVAVLNGGFKSWLKMNYPTTPKSVVKYLPGNFNGKLNKDLFCDWAQVRNQIGKHDCQIIDARSSERFQGAVQEPREGLRSGHIPGAVNIPYAELIADYELKPTDEIKKIFSAKYSKNRFPIYTCGSGITACILALGAQVAGLPEGSVYDGSWTEWGSLGHLPIEKGPA